jgi:hypothetical protein
MVAVVSQSLVQLEQTRSGVPDSFLDYDMIYIRRDKVSKRLAMSTGDFCLQLAQSTIQKPRDIHISVEHVSPHLVLRSGDKARCFTSMLERQNPHNPQPAYFTGKRSYSFQIQGNLEYKTTIKFRDEIIPSTKSWSEIVAASAPQGWRPPTTHRRYWLAPATEHTTPSFRLQQQGLDLASWGSARLAYCLCLLITYHPVLIILLLSIYNTSDNFVLIILTFLFRYSAHRVTACSL